MKSSLNVIVLLSSAYAGGWANASEDADAARGAELFRQCAACHSVVPGEHLTGPSLAEVVGRKAGTAAGFERYSQAMQGSNLEWTKQNLDAWLESPAALVPGTSMRVPGIEDPDARRHIIAYLESTGEASRSAEAGAGAQGPMGGMGGPRLENLKEPAASRQVTRISHCGDAYRVTLGTGDTYTFWEFNLRFKTDSSANGPPKGKPAILRGGMMGDRAFVIFSGPEEISAFIDRSC